jgi:hypothetical protein
MGVGVPRQHQRQFHRTDGRCRRATGRADVDNLARLGGFGRGDDLEPSLEHQPRVARDWWGAHWSAAGSFGLMLLVAATTADFHYAAAMPLETMLLVRVR